MLERVGAGKILGEFRVGVEAGELCLELELKRVGVLAGIRIRES